MRSSLSVRTSKMEGEGRNGGEKKGKEKEEKGKKRKRIQKESKEGRKERRKQASKEERKKKKERASIHGEGSQQNPNPPSKQQFWAQHAFRNGLDWGEKEKPPFLSPIAFPWGPATA